MRNSSLGLLVAIGVSLLTASSHADRRFTVADDIGVSYFGIPHMVWGDAVTFSPNGEYFVVATTRGALDTNQAESMLRIYRTEDVRRFLVHPEVTREPTPIWRITKSAFDHGKYGSVIGRIQWLANSKSFAFSAGSQSRNRQLFLADLQTKTDHALTPEVQDVDNFDILDEKHFIYFVPSPKVLERASAEDEVGSAVATGRSIQDLVFPEDFMREDDYDLAELWAVVDGQRFRVDDKSTAGPLPLHSNYQTWPALSPDGRTVITQMVVRTVPEGWATLYPPPYPGDPFAANTGQQDPGAFGGRGLISEYVSIDLASGEVRSLVHAPTGWARGWWGSEVAAWSADGKSIVLSNTFLPPKTLGKDDRQNMPCAAAVVETETGQFTCLGWVHGVASEADATYNRILARFAPDGSRNVTVDYATSRQGRVITTYSREHGGPWVRVATCKQSNCEHDPLDLSVKEDLNDPPVLVATDKTAQVSRVILDPNPQLKDINLGEASVLRWKDKTGRDWVGGLYKPPDYVLGKKYPLVIQTHGFWEHRFEPSGLFPSAFAARELAAAGIIVLQVPMCGDDTPEEGRCQVAGFDSGVEKLASEGIVDPDHVGLVGFSRTCYAVLAALTTSKLHYAAASITDGNDMGYLQYLSHLDVWPDNEVERDFETVNGGAPPFGEGLQLWLQRSPNFNLGKVTAPLQVVAHGRIGLLEEWEPYAVLRLMNKPVDLTLLTKRSTHVLSNPKQRMISQGGTVEWMRFWLQAYEVPDPAKAEQYARWRELRKQNKREIAGNKSPR